MPLLSFAEYARHRGVSRAAVTQAVRDGRITPVIDPVNGKRMLDPAQADRQWQQNTEHDKRVNGQGAAPVAPESESGAEPETAAETGPGSEAGTEDAGEEDDAQSQGIPTLIRSKAIKEAYLARLAKVRYERQIRKLVEADQVAKEAFETGRLVRDAILNIPARISGELASETDPLKVHEMLTRELTRALEEVVGAGRS